MSLARRPLNDYMEPTQPSFIKLSDIMDKEVISSTTGRKLGKLGEAWVDPSRLEVTCFDLENNGAVGVVPLLTIKQAGDVVLVQEDGVLRQPLDSRFGFTKLLGWEVRTPSNRALGKVRQCLVHNAQASSIHLLIAALYSFAATFITQNPTLFALTRSPVLLTPAYD